MSNLRSLSSRQKKFTQEAQMPVYNKTAQPIKQVAKPNNNINKGPEKPKISIADAIGLITIRLGKVEQFIIDLNMNEKFLHSTPPVIDQNQNMNTAEQHLILLNTSLERIQNIENSTKNIEKFDSDLRDTKDLLIKLMSKQEKSLEEHEVKHSNIYTFINNKLDDLIEKRVNDLLNHRIDALVDKRVNEVLNDRADEIIFNKVDELVNDKVNKLLKKTADEIISRNMDDIINIKYNEVATSSSNETESVSLHEFSQ
jgi:hypothetical protein